MKILLICPYNFDVIHSVSLPLGIMSIGTNLIHHGFDVKIYNSSVTHESIIKVFNEYKPDIVGVSVHSVKHIDGALYVSKKLHKKGVPIVWGGPFCDVAESEVIFNSKCVDIISFCEGEETWVDLVNTIQSNGDLSTVKGIAYLNDKGEIITTPQRDFIDLTKLPPIDYTLVDVKAHSQYLYGCNNLYYLYLAKGCPAKCTFCVNQLLHRNQYRRRDINQFMDEVKLLVTQYGMDGFYFGDEVCFLNSQQLDEVCSAIEESGLDIRWGFQTRIGLMAEKDFQRCYDCGCRWVDFGIESGNKEQLKIMKKAIPYDLIEPTFEICDKIGLISIANFIIGLPGETEEQLMDTINLAKRLKATQRTFVHYCFTPKTEMGKAAVEAGLLKHPIKKIRDYKKVDFFRSRMDNMSQISTKELNVVQSYFLWEAIFKKNYGDVSRHYDIFAKHIFTLFRRLSFLFFPDAIKCFAEFVYLGLRFFCGVYFHPKILKKYGLDNKINNKNN